MISVEITKEFEEGKDMKNGARQRLRNFQLFKL